MQRIKKSPVTAVLIVLACAVFAFSRLAVPLTNTAEASIFCGAYYKPMILAGQWWRMLTVMLTHGSVMHLAVNCYSLYSLGGFLENRNGSLRFLAVFVFSVFGGSLFVLAAGTETVAVGMSAGLYGLMAWWLKMLYARRAHLIPAVKNAMIRVLAVNLLINLLPGISWLAHLGGFLFGLILSEILAPDYAEQMHRSWVIAGTLFCIGCGVLTGTRLSMDGNEIYAGSDLNVLRAYDRAGLHQNSRKLARNLDRLYGINYLETEMEKENG